MPGATEVTEILDQLEPLHAKLESVVKQMADDVLHRDGVVAQQVQELQDVRDLLKDIKQERNLFKKDLVASQAEVHNRGNKLAELQKEIEQLKKIEAKWLEISKHFP